ncbi:MAG TPA: vitamin K epoxide reductase family protein, partial [Candidatus Dormibacteraeota bacterium]
MPRLKLAAVAASVVGVGISIYLTMLHYAGITPACPVSGSINCEAVLSSSYAVIAGTSVPTSVAGIVWFGISALL